MANKELLNNLMAVVEDCCDPSSDYASANVDMRLDILQLKLGQLLGYQDYGDLMTDSQEVTILLSDLRGFTALSENYPAKDVMELLNRYFTRMSEIIIIQHGGTIDKFMGDSIMVLFGAPDEKQDDLSQALACAIHMQIAMDDINQQNETLGMPTLFMGIGINTGKVMAGKLGSELHSEYTVIGDEVNLASRIEAYSLRGQVLISENSYLKAKGYIETGEATEVFVKGKSHPVLLYELLSVSEPAILKVPCREVRKSPRIEVNLPLTFNKVSGKSISYEKSYAEIIDLSYNGMLIITEKALAPFSEIKFCLALSLVVDQASDIYGKVLKCSEKDSQWLVNIEFTSIGERAKDALKNYINRIIQGI